MWFKVSDEHEAHAGWRAQLSEKFEKRFQSSGRSTHTHDGESVRSVWGLVGRGWTVQDVLPARSWDARVSRISMKHSKGGGKIVCVTVLFQIVLHPAASLLDGTPSQLTQSLSLDRGAGVEKGIKPSGWKALYVQ
jgi:hypothetical protein